MLHSLQQHPWKHLCLSQGQYQHVVFFSLPPFLLHPSHCTFPTAPFLLPALSFRIGVLVPTTSCGADHCTGRPRWQCLARKCDDPQTLDQALGPPCPPGQPQILCCSRNLERQCLHDGRGRWQPLVQLCAQVCSPGNISTSPSGDASST